VSDVTGDLRILTGAPGTGKTALLTTLGGDIHWIPEPAREVLAEHPTPEDRALFEEDPGVFVDLLLQRSIDKYDKARGRGGLVLFDRGVPDCIAYATHLDADPTASIAAAARHRYHPEVMLLEPWAEIYTTDDERTMTFDHVLQFHGHLERAYEDTGYQLVSVPEAPIGERAEFVRRIVSGEG
jgi:predicted ATPase